MSTLPMMVDLAGKRMVVVGGGAVAEKRVKTLNEKGAFITLISPSLTSTLKCMIDDGKIIWKKKKFGEEDIIDVFAVVIATNDMEVNEVALQAASQVPLVNYTPEASRGKFSIPAYFSRGKLTIAVSTEGASPMLTSRIKAGLEKGFEEDYGQYVDFLYECRQQIKRSSLPKGERESLLKHLLQETYKSPDQQKIFKKHLETITEGEGVM
jgi:precorrin-2 dehydrogenase/sirohydrochlorin ferrochelatase